MAIYDSFGNLVAKYVYDAWGNHKVLNPDGTENTNANFIGNISPFRYRSYYFDVETGLYYLQSRYYDPQVGRFISMDQVEYLAPDVINGLNLYAYCLNNPVMASDPDGTSWDWGKFWKCVTVVAVAVVVVATVAVVTVASGGTATPVLVGAGVGAATSLGSSVASQALRNGSFENIDWGEVVVDCCVGMVTGAIGGSTLGRIGSTLGNGFAEAVGSGFNDWVSGEKFSLSSALVSFGTGAFFSGFASGAQNGYTKRLKRARKNYKIKNTSRTKSELDEAKKALTKQSLQRMKPDVNDFLLGFIGSGTDFLLGFSF